MEMSCNSLAHNLKLKSNRNIVRIITMDMSCWLLPYLKTKSRISNTKRYPLFTVDYSRGYSFHQLSLISTSSAPSTDFKKPQ